MENVTAQAKTGTDQQVVVFNLGTELYAIDIFRVHEIIRQREITKVPGSPYHMKGLINLRGKTIPVVDFAGVLGVDANSDSENSRIIVVETPNGNVGLIVDEVKEVITFAVADVEDAPAVITETGSDAVNGVAKQDGKLITMVDLDRALAA